MHWTKKRLLQTVSTRHQPLHHRWQLCLTAPHLRPRGDELVAQVALLAHAVVLRQGDWLAQRQRRTHLHKHPLATPRRCLNHEYHIVLGQHAQRTADEFTWCMAARPGWVEKITIHGAAHLLERCHHCVHPSAHHRLVLTGKGIGAKNGGRGGWWNGVHTYIVYATTAQGYILLFFVLFLTIFASVAGWFFTNLISHPVISMLRWVV